MGQRPCPPSSSSSSSSLGEASRSGSEVTSCSSSDVSDDATSSSSTLTHSTDCRDRGPLCELSDLMTHLPIKRGLSRHYTGKSQSFTSLASARNLEDLAKENPRAKRLKLCVGGSRTQDWGRRSLSYRQNMEAKRPALLQAPINDRPPIPIVRTF